MAEINKKLVKYATEAKFEEHLTGLADKINPKSVVFIEDTGRIWTHGKYYDGAWAGISGKPTTFAPSAHKHGPITNEGKIGTSANRIIETTTGGALTPVAKNTAYNRAFGTGENQVARGNHTHDDRYKRWYRDHGIDVDANRKENTYLSGYRWVNTPIDGIGILETNNQYSNDWVTQEFTRIIGVPRKFIRTFHSGHTWGEWFEYWHKGNLTKLTQLTNDLPNFTRTVAGLVPSPTTNTTTRYLREDGTWVIPPNTGDTHWTTGIRAGASGTNSNSVANDPFIKVLDNTTYRSQVQILGGTNITAKSDATGKITIDGTHNHDTVYVKKIGDTMTGKLTVLGTAASQSLQVRGVVGSNATGSAVDSLYLQYGANKPVMFGNTGAYNISADGSSYSGTAANATNAANASKLGNVALGGLFTTLAKTTDNKLSITIGGINKTLALGSNAFDSTAYLPLSGGTLSNSQSYLSGNSFSGILDIVNTSTGISGEEIGPHISFRGNRGASDTGTYVVYGAIGAINTAPSGASGGALVFLTKNANGAAQTPTEQMRIATGGNVGIGITSPAYKLDVSGDVRATGTFRGSLTGNASSASTVALTADNSSNATRYPLFVSSATGNLSPRTDTGFKYNPSTGALTTTTFIGALTGNASTATKLQTARKIAGVSFNGTADIAIPFTNLANKPTTISGYGITDAYTKVEVDGLAKYIGRYGSSNGFLVKTNVARTENAMLVLHIKGNSYWGLVPINTFVQAYNYRDSDAIIETGALNNGYKINEVKAFYYDNLVYFWVPQQTTFQTMTFQLLKKEEQVNRVASVSNSAVPTTGVEKLVTIIPRTAWFENTLTNLNQLTTRNFSDLQNKPTTLSGYGITDGALNTLTLTAGNGLTGGGTLKANRTITLGTPSAITALSSNSVSAQTHTHLLQSSTVNLNTGLNTDIDGFVSGSTGSPRSGSVMGTWTTLRSNTAYGAGFFARANQAWFRTRENGVMQGWNEFWHSGNLTKLSQLSNDLFSSPTFSGDTTITGDIILPKSNGNITWNSATWQQRIATTDTSSTTSDVFTFQESSNSGASWKNLMTIKADGTVEATTFIGALTGNASSATALTTNAGSAKQPIYFSGGKPIASTSTVGGTTTPMYLKAGVMTALGYTIAKSVPSGAKFTDENVKYTLAADNQEYRMLMSEYYSTAPTTLGIKYTDNIRINPYLSKITATTFSGKATSAGNADTVGGLYVNPIANTTANRLVRTDGSGYIQAGWINTTSGTASGTLNRVYVSQDSYLRYLSPTNFISSLGLATESYVNNIEIGGRNLIKNSQESFKVEYSGSGELNKQYNVGSGITTPLTIDNEYTISLRARGTIRINVFRISSTGNSSIPFVGKNELSETEFRDFSMTFRPHRDELTAIYLTTGYNTGVSGWYEIDENSLKVEKGNKATDWTPAPEDQISDWSITDEASFSYIKNKPTTLAGYGITDAVTTNTTQTITGAKTFSKLLTANAGISTTTITASGIITAKEGNSTNWNKAYADSHTHTNKAQLDVINQNLSMSSNVGFSSAIIENNIEVGELINNGKSFMYDDLEMVEGDIFANDIEASSFKGALSGNASSATNLSRSILAGNGLIGGGVLDANRTLTLGTPGTITSSTTNLVGESSHTHALTITKADILNLGISEVGPQGPRGYTGDKGDKPSHGWSGTSLRFENPNGTWGTYVNLKGDTGATGARGPAGSNGTNGFTWRPSVNAAGDLTWTRNSSTTTPYDSNIKGPKGDAGAPGAPGLTTSIKVNGSTYTQSSGQITLPSYVPVTGGTFTGSITATRVYRGSDIRLKDNMCPIDTSKIDDIKLIGFNWKSDNKKDYGVRAQEVEKLYPELISTNTDGMKSVNYESLYAIKIARLEERIKELEDKLWQTN